MQAGSFFDDSSIIDNKFLEFIKASLSFMSENYCLFKAVLKHAVTNRRGGLSEVDVATLRRVADEAAAAATVICPTTEEANQVTLSGLTNIAAALGGREIEVIAQSVTSFVALQAVVAEGNVIVVMRQEDGTHAQYVGPLGSNKGLLPDEFGRVLECGEIGRSNVIQINWDK